MAKFRRCSRCKVDRSVSDFFRNKRRLDGLCIYCKFCHVKSSSGREWKPHLACSKCGNPCRSKSLMCIACKTACTCGQPKDFRADLCRSCASTRQTSEQWSNQQSRSKLVKGVRRAGLLRRTTFDKLELSSFKSTKTTDHRAYTYFFDGEQKRTIYRYQWVWIKAHGPIPKDSHIHHINHDCTDDRLQNLQLMASKDHKAYHGAVRSSNTPQPPEWKCQRCGIRFRMLPRGKNGIRQFCSLRCKNSHASLMRHRQQSTLNGIDT